MTLPNFLICGAQKAGTTSLHHLLAQHPDIFMSEPKETWFFDMYYDRGLPWFARHFQNYSGQKAVGEATARTMACIEAPKRIEETLKDPLLIFLLRNPIDRAYSQFFYYVFTGKCDPDRSFSEVIRDSRDPFRNDMLDCGRYVRQLERYSEVFGSERMKTLFFEDLVTMPVPLVQDVCRFLDVDDTFVPASLSAKNVTWYPRHVGVYSGVRTAWSVVRPLAHWLAPRTAQRARRRARRVLFERTKPPMSARDREYLRNAYRDDNQALSEYLGIDLGHWN